MRTSKMKALLSALTVVIIVAAVSAAMIVPAVHNEEIYYRDGRQREELAGTLDFLMIGASHCLSAFVPEVLDESLGCRSYNLANTMMTMPSKLYLLEKELQRNPVSTVVLELSYDTLSRTEKTEYAVGDFVFLQRLDSFGEALRYMTRSVSLDDWLNIYARGLTAGLDHLTAAITGHTGAKVNFAKGYYPLLAADVRLSPEEAIKEYNRTPIPDQYLDGSIAMLEQMIELCRSYGAEVIVAVVPLSDTMNWRFAGFDSFEELASEICRKMNCPFYDFNLCKTRWDWLDDEWAYLNEGHLSDRGAHAFSKVFAETLQKASAGEDVSALFFTSYKEMEQYSPYMQQAELAQ